MLEQTVLENLSHVTGGTLGRFGFVLDRGEIAQRAQVMVERLRIKVGSLDVLVGQLSGGNQQKVVLGKWLGAEPDVILLNDPTRGVDVGSKAEIYEICRQLADEGRIVLFASSELLEYALLCERVLVFFRGEVTCELAGNSITEHSILEAINTGRAGTDHQAEQT
jgi:ribose transport system ATP-binding protein